MATGRDNPRGLTFGTDGALYVAEAGRGGESDLCLPPPDGMGQIDAADRPAPLPASPASACTSASSPDCRRSRRGRHQCRGPQDIQFGFGHAWVPIGLGAGPGLRAPFAAAGIHLGHLVRIMPTGAWEYVVDISAHEAATNPDGGHIDSNPFKLRVLADRAVIADAGANALLQISAFGAVSTLAVLPERMVPNPFGPGEIPIESVPTSVVEGPGGTLFVGELTGFPFPVGAARIFQVPAGGGTPVPVLGGFTTIIGLAFGPDGAGYVLEHDADGIVPPRGPELDGRLIRLEPGTGQQRVLAHVGFTKPGRLTVGPGQCCVRHLQQHVFRQWAGGANRAVRGTIVDCRLPIAD